MLVQLNDEEEKTKLDTEYKKNTIKDRYTKLYESLKMKINKHIHFYCLILKNLACYSINANKPLEINTSAC